MKRIISLITLICFVLSVPVFSGWKQDAKGKWYERDDGSYPKSCVENIEGELYSFDDEGYIVDHKNEINLGDQVVTQIIDMSKYDQLKIDNYSLAIINLRGINSKGEKVRVVYHVNIPIVSGYDSDKINRALNSKATELLENYIQSIYDFANTEKKKKPSSYLLNKEATIQLGNGYLIFSFNTWGRYNIVLKYDLLNEDLSIIK